jgi:hypothetical protein
MGDRTPPKYEPKLAKSLVSFARTGNLETYGYATAKTSTNKKTQKQINFVL